MSFLIDDISNYDESRCDCNYFRHQFDWNARSTSRSLREDDRNCLAGVVLSGSSGGAALLSGVAAGRGKWEEGGKRVGGLERRREGSDGWEAYARKTVSIPSLSDSQ